MDDDSMTGGSAVTGLQRGEPYALRPLGAILRASALYIAIATLGVVLAVWADVTNKEWQVSDWIALLYGTILAVGLTFVGRRQQQLQEAMANLELREKVGVIEAAGLGSTSNTDPLWCLHVASDCRAALHLFPLAKDSQQVDLLVAINRAFRSMRESGIIDTLTDTARECVYFGVQGLAEEMGRVVSRSNSAAIGAFDQVGRLKAHMEARDDTLKAPSVPRDLTTGI